MSKIGEYEQNYMCRTAVMRLNTRKYTDIDSQALPPFFRVFQGHPTFFSFFPVVFRVFWSQISWFSSCVIFRGFLLRVCYQFWNCCGRIYPKAVRRRWIWPDFAHFQDRLELFSGFLAIFCPFFRIYFGKFSNSGLNLYLLN